MFPRQQKKIIQKSVKLKQLKSIENVLFIILILRNKFDLGQVNVWPVKNKGKSLNRATQKGKQFCQCS